VDLDGDFTIDYIYAGDLSGNVWKFDVSNPAPTSWQVAYGGPLFTAEISGTPQPITSYPEVGLHPQNGLLIYFGTGKYLETADNTAVGIPTQTFYAIWDKNESTLTSFTRTALLQQEVLAVVSGNRVTSDHAIDWTVHRGWYLDLPTQGERQVSDSVLRSNKIIFTTLIPNSQICGTGGSGWLMELDAHSGSRLAFPPFDLNDDDEFDEYDMVTVMINGSNVTVPVSGVISTEGILTSPAVLPSGNIELKYAGGSSGSISVTTENPGPGARGRQAWRSLP
jgi:type IV pilus assembly protein PilY1